MIWYGLGGGLALGFVLVVLYFVFDSSWWILGSLLVLGLTVYTCLEMIPFRKTTCDDIVKRNIRKKALHKIVNDYDAVLMTRSQYTSMRKVRTKFG